MCPIFSGHYWNIILYVYLKMKSKMLVLFTNSKQIIIYSVFMLRNITFYCKKVILPLSNKVLINLKMKVMKILKKVALMATVMTIPFVAFAQDEVEASVGADVVSSYIWRGQDLGNAAIQPSVSLSYNGFSLGAWASYGVVESSEKEIDLFLGYSVGGFSIGVTDYFCNFDEKYFLYKAHETAHTFEATVGYDFGPLAVNWSTNFAGSDGITETGKRAYASYVEVSAPFKLGGLDWSASLGATPYADGGFYSDNHATGFAVQQVSVKASKDIKVSSTFVLPVFAQLTANPSSQKMYFTFGVSL